MPCTGVSSLGDLKVAALTRSPSEVTRRCDVSRYDAARKGVAPKPLNSGQVPFTGPSRAHCQLASSRADRTVIVPALCVPNTDTIMVVSSRVEVRCQVDLKGPVKGTCPEFRGVAHIISLLAFKSNESNVNINIKRIPTRFITASSFEHSHVIV
jgi:hypothetical protein